MHLSSLVCFLSVCGLCSAFFLLKDKGKSVVLCGKICPLYCNKNRRNDEDASSNDYLDDQNDYTVDATTDDYGTNTKPQRFLLCKPTSTTPSTTSTSSTTPSTTSTSSSTSTSTTTTSSTTTTTTTMKILKLGSNGWPAWPGLPGPPRLPGTSGTPGNQDSSSQVSSYSLENDTSSDYEVQSPNRFLVPCNWLSGTATKELEGTRRKRDDDDSSYIYVEDGPSYFDHYSPLDHHTPPHHYELYPPRHYKRYKEDIPTTTKPTPSTTTEEPTYICAVCKQKCE